MTVIPTQPEAQLHRNSLAKQQSTSDEFSDKQCSCLRPKEEGAVISKRAVSIGGGCRVPGTSFIRMGSSL